MFKRSYTQLGMSADARNLLAQLHDVQVQLKELSLHDEAGRNRIARVLTENVLSQFVDTDFETLPLYVPLQSIIRELIDYEGWFVLRGDYLHAELLIRSELWELEEELQKVRKMLDGIDQALDDVVSMIAGMIEPIIAGCPALLAPATVNNGDIVFQTLLAHSVPNLASALDTMVQLPFAPELETFGMLTRLTSRLQFNMIVATGLPPSDPKSFEKTLRLPSNAPTTTSEKLITAYMGGTPFERLFAISVPLIIPKETRFEHAHLIAGSGHGKTQSIQHFILSDLDAVAKGEASIVVIDSQKDLIDTIRGLAMFREGQPLCDRLCVIDPTDVEYPVALNLFDIGMERINSYSMLDRERLINGVLELYDFVLGSLLDAGMTQKQNVIFRYITRLLLHIPNATIHTFRALLEDNGYATYAPYISKLTGSARAFFETEFQSKEFVQTKKQVLRRLYGILENQTFERMFSHPKSKLDLFTEMNAGKVILINTAKDLLKENGTEIFGRFFIAMIAQAAQDRAVIAKDKRMPTFVYVDEASDYFDQNIGIILNQARKQNVGMTISHQFLGQLDSKLHEAIAANTAIKFAGGVSAKDARALAADLRCDPSFIEAQDKLSFAAYIKGVTKQAVSLSIQGGRMEALARLKNDEKASQQDRMRTKYAIHYSEVFAQEETISKDEPEAPEPISDTGEPMPWE
jgi:hypothetical protein